jgi:hypothetical protein
MSAVDLKFVLSGDGQMVLDTVRRFSAGLREAMREAEKNGVSDSTRRTWEDLGLAELQKEMGCQLKLQSLREMAIGDAATTLALEGPGWVAWTLSQCGESVDGEPAAAIDLDGRIAVDGNRLKGRLPYLPAAGAEQLYLLTDGGLFSLPLSALNLDHIDVAALDAAGGCSAEIDGAARAIPLSESDAALLNAHWRLLPAALLTGLSRAAYAHAREYCLERTTFGKKVAHHQGVAFILADMLVATESAELMLDHAGATMDAAGWDAGAVSVLEATYLHAVESALFVTNYAVQLLGAAGYVSDHPVEKWMREARALSLLWGGADGALESAGAALEGSL